MELLSLVTLAAFAAATKPKPTVYLIRHGEKPEDDDERGLSAAGMQRAQCLRRVFGASSPYNIGHIMAQEYKPSGARRRAYDTVKPVADDLGLTVDVSCDRDDPDCVANVVEDYNGSGNILIAWEHKKFNNIVAALGGDHENYPDDRFDIIWIDEPPYKEIIETSEHCQGLDD